MTSNKIITDINDHLAKSNKQSYSDFYIGITNDINRRLFWEHNVPKNGHRYITCPAGNETTARYVEDYYLKKWMKWWSWWWNWNWDAIYVYCYEISSNTNE